MEMLPPAPVPSNVVVGATVVKRFPGYGERRGTIAEIEARPRRSDSRHAAVGRRAGAAGGARTA